MINVIQCLCNIAINCRINTIIYTQRSSVFGHSVGYGTTDELLLNMSLLWRHNGHTGVSNHQHHDCLLNHSFRRRLKKTSKLRITGLCAGNSPVTGEFPAQMASNEENVPIWWRHHVIVPYLWKTRATEITCDFTHDGMLKLKWDFSDFVLFHPAILSQSYLYVEYFGCGYIVTQSKAERTNR